MTDRLPFARNELAGRTVRGVAINVVFLLIVEGANLANGLLVARLLGPSDIGLYGIVSITATTLIALKRVGIDEAYVQQDEANQELEFHLAFTLELVLGVLFAVLLLVAAPILVAIYDEGELLWLTLAVSYLPIAFALQAPLWVFFRRMDFLRQRSLQAIVPVVSFLVTVPMVIAGVGVWALVIGPLVANVVACFFAIRMSPYKLRVRWDSTAAKRYFAFSWPVFVVTACGLLIGQGQVLIFNIHGGLEATGFLALAAVLTRYADRADQVISPTIYPAICAVRDSEPTLDRIFVAAARAAAVWSLAYGMAFVLFAPDLVTWVLGPDWTGAVPLLQGLAASWAVYQLGFSWIAFARGLGRTKPPALEGVIALAVFAFVAVPLLFTSGTGAFAIAMVVVNVAVLFVRTYFIRRLLPGVALGRLALRALWPVALAAAAVVALRLGLWGGSRDEWQAIAEVLLFGVVYAGATYAGERGLVRDLLAAARPVTV